MRHVVSLQSTKSESPKTPGGISKSLLTPCRRVGLSRNWKKAGPSPFISPVPGSTQSNVVVKVEKKDTRKRKEPTPDDETVVLYKETTPTEGDGVISVDGIVAPSEATHDIKSTPNRQIALPRKKKSRLIADKGKDKKSNYKSPLREAQCREEKREDTIDSTERSTEPVKQVIDTLSTPIRQTSLSTTKKQTATKLNAKCTVVKDIEVKENVDSFETKSKEESPSRKSPNNLTKECVVLIQKRVFKTEAKDSQMNQKNEKDFSNINHNNKILSTKENETVLQIKCDSDSDDVPLCNLNKKEHEKANLEPHKQPEIIIIEDDDFTETKKAKVAKLVDKNTSMGGLKSGTSYLIENRKHSTSKTEKKIKIPFDYKTVSQKSIEDDDDFDFETKRTILIRKTYNKVSKPVKAKTTGSITQTDIDELQARIEVKKKVLLAKATTEETKELRDLIKKWQKGCQDALAELMDLMKRKCPDKKYMDYSEMLQMLKIPSYLVGYNSEDDCFNTPDDATIVLSNFNDI